MFSFTLISSPFVFDQINRPRDPSKSPSSSELEMVVIDLSEELSAKTTSLKQVEIEKKNYFARNSSKKGTLDGWGGGRTFGIQTMAFAFITNLFAALWGVSGGFGLSSSSYKAFLILLMTNFYSSIVGILLNRVFPAVAKGFHLMAFLCAMLSVTILFSGLVPSEIKCMPWVLMTIVLLLVIGLLAHELSSLSNQSS
ncbi:conserved hypothetical protein [Ricinus communis]|uniref:Uncharacterized protein n=1 Tax=Ricinus communis TaxID=3988 RepID=B9T5H3_RICCO|nr:conserved hypothetical protein [Ricinus communis]